MDGVGSFLRPELAWMTREIKRHQRLPKGSGCRRILKPPLPLTLWCHKSHCLPCWAQSSTDKKRSVIRTENQLQAFPSEKFLSRSNQSMRLHRQLLCLANQKTVPVNDKTENRQTWTSEKTNFILIRLIGQFAQIVFIYKFLLNLRVESWCTVSNSVAKLKYRMSDKPNREFIRLTELIKDGFTFCVVRAWVISMLICVDDNSHIKKQQKPCTTLASDNDTRLVKRYWLIPRNPHISHRELEKVKNEKPRHQFPCLLRLAEPSVT